MSGTSGSDAGAKASVGGTGVTTGGSNSGGTTSGVTSGGATAGTAGSSQTGGAPSTCPSYAGGRVVCGGECYGNCYGVNAENMADANVHVGHCTFVTATGITLYCAPYGVSEPCTYCP